MDPISAVGIAASVAQFVGLGLKVGARLKEYNSATTDPPKSLQRINSQLPLLIGALERVKTGSEVEKVDINTRCILKGVVAGCMQQVEKIDKIIDRVSHVPGDSLRIKVQKVFVSIKNDEKVLAIEKNLQTYISILILHQVIEGPDLSLSINEEAVYFEVPIKKIAPFFDRVELQEIETHLQPAVTSQVIDPIYVALVGQEGVGKTQLALEYSHQANAARQFQTVFWLDATIPQNLSRSLESVSDIIRRSKEGLKDGSEKIDFVKSFLCQRWHPWLLVLDNYNPVKFKNIAQFLPSRGPGAILLISCFEDVPLSTHVIRVPKFRSPEVLEQLRESLVRAVLDNNLKRIATLLDDGADPDSRDIFGWPCLHHAVDQENKTAVELLLAKGANPRAQDPTKPRGEVCFTALYRAVSTGNIAITKLLLDEEDFRGLTPPAPGNNAVFSKAAEKGYKDIVQILISHRSVDFDGRNENGETALALASQNGHSDIVKMLLDYNADAEAESYGATPLTWAARNNRLDVVKLLCEQGKADPNVGNLTSQTDQPPLWHAVCASKGSIDMVKYLLESGADPNRSSKTETSPLQEAVLREFESVVSILLKYTDPYPINYYRFPPICDAIRFGDENITSLLLQAHSTNLAVRQQQQEQALMMASAQGRRNIVLLLLDAGIDINVVGDGGNTPLISAIENKDTPTTRLLLRRGARSDIMDREGQYPLHIAATKGLDLIVKEILSSSKNPNLRNKNEDTPLCLAVAKGHLKVVKILLEHGANPHLTNKFDDTPLDLAIDGNYEAIIDILMKTGDGLRDQ